MKIFFLLLITISSLSIQSQCDSLKNVHILGYREHTSPISFEGENKYNYDFDLLNDSITPSYCSIKLRKREMNKISNLFFKYYNIKLERVTNDGNDYLIIIILNFENSVHYFGFTEGLRENIYVNGEKVIFDNSDGKYINRSIPRKCRDVLSYRLW